MDTIEYSQESLSLIMEIVGACNTFAMDYTEEWYLSNAISRGNTLAAAEDILKEVESFLEELGKLKDEFQLPDPQILVNSVAEIIQTYKGEDDVEEFIEYLKEVSALGDVDDDEFT